MNPHTTFALTHKGATLTLKNPAQYAHRFLTLEIANSSGAVQAVDILLKELETALSQIHNQTEVSCGWKSELKHSATLNLVPEEDGYLKLTLHETAMGPDGMFETEYREAHFRSADLLSLVARYKSAHPYAPMSAPTDLARWDKQW